MISNKISFLFINKPTNDFLPSKKYWGNILCSNKYRMLCLSNFDLPCIHDFLIHKQKSIYKLNFPLYSYIIDNCSNCLLEIYLCLYIYVGAVILFVFLCNTLNQQKTFYYLPLKQPFPYQFQEHHFYNVYTLYFLVTTQKKSHIS